jgi:pyridoxal phosphate enzyme (YggS family)
MTQPELAQRITALQVELEQELAQLHRAPHSAKLCAVSKGHPREAIESAIAAGVTDIGESYVQEAVPKLAGLTGVTKHFIGHIQSNKAKSIVANFDVIHAVDRIDAGIAIARAVQSLGRGVRVLVQVNISPTERYGVRTQDASDLALALRQLDLHVDGIMAIGPQTADPEILKRSFEEAAKCFAQIGGSTFSIGMSSDWRQAVANGSTLIRIGTAIFGQRQAKSTDGTYG